MDTRAHQENFFFIKDIKQASALHVLRLVPLIFLGLVLFAPMATAGGRVRVTKNATVTNDGTGAQAKLFVGDVVELTARYTDSSGTDDTSAGGWRWWVQYQPVPEDYDIDHDARSGYTMTAVAVGQTRIYAQKNIGCDEPRDSIRVRVIDAKVAIEVSEDAVAAGQKVTISSRLNASGGSPVANKTVNLRAEFHNDDAAPPTWEDAGAAWNFTATTNTAGKFGPIDSPELAAKQYRVFGCFDSNGNTVEDAGESDSAYIIGAAVSLQMVAIDTNVPDISPNVCLNAQATYKKAIWKATVLPVGTTAEVRTNGKVSASPTVVSDGTIVEVEATSTGEYQIRLVHGVSSDVESSFVTGSSFEFAFENIDVSPGPDNSVSDSDGDGVIEQDNGALGNANFSSSLFVHLSKSSHPNNGNATGDATWTYKLVTQPENAYAGNVKCPTSIATKSESGIIQCTAIISVGGIGPGSSSVDYDSTITVSGLAIGDGSIIMHHGVSAPVRGLVMLDFDIVTGTLNIDQPAAIYVVGTTVSAAFNQPLVAARDGAFPGSGSARGNVDVLGITFTPGPFLISQ